MQPGEKRDPFLVGPGDHLDGAFRRFSRILEAFQNLECGECSKRAVVAATCGLAVEMAADQQRGHVAATPRAADEEVRHRILKDVKAALDGEVRKKPARLAVAPGQRLPVDAALVGRADCRELFQPAVEPFRFDRGHRSAGSGASR
jgi:hypothetical protein